MNIVSFSPYYLPYISGMVTYPDRIFQTLAITHTITVLTFRHDKTLPSSEQINDYTVVRMPFIARLSKGFISPQSLVYFFQAVQRNEVVIVNLPNVEGVFLAILAKIFRKKLIGIFHCTITFDSSFTNQLLQWVIRFSIWVQSALCDHIIAYTKDYIDHASGIQQFRGKIHYALPPIPYFEADPVFTKKLTTQKADTLWVGFAGRVSHEKGLHVLIDAISTIADSYDRPIALVVAGSFGKDVAGEAEYYTRICRLLEKKNVTAHFLGILHTRELASFYESIDMLVLPSVNSTEAFGMVQAEAMLHGTPVITSNLPGVRVPVQETGMGIVLPTTTPTTLAEAINQILKHPTRYSNPNRVQKAKKVFQSSSAIQTIVNTLHR